MSTDMYLFLSGDLFPLLAGILAALFCGLLGNHLILRQQSMMGDAISHAVLPGLVGAFVLSGSRNPAIMFFGAAGSAIVTVVLIQLVRKLGRVEPGAAMGVIFSVMFALGVLLLEQAQADGVDLDPSCVLYGQLESLFWTPPREWNEFFSFSTFNEIPRQIWTLLGTNIAVIGFMVLFFKELRVSAFDPGISSSQGINAGVIRFVLMLFVAGASVASFEAVGSILVIAMLICPPAAARLLTDRMGPQIIVSAVLAVASAVFGYVVSANIPEAWVRGGSVNAAGMMAVMSGVFVALAAIFSPTHGSISKARRRRALTKKIHLEDLLSALFRFRESGQPAASAQQLAPLVGHQRVARIALDDAIAGELVVVDAGMISLTVSGYERAASLIRKHRMWEGYLVDQAGMPADHVHPVAERLEHLSSPVPKEADAPHGDQHGKPIPPAN